MFGWYVGWVVHGWFVCGVTCDMVVVGSGYGCVVSHVTQCWRVTVMGGERCHM